MKVLVEVAEAAERLEEFIELATRGDEILICRDERPVARLTSVTRNADALQDFLALAAEGRKNVPAGTTSDHSDFYDEHGLPR